MADQQLPADAARSASWLNEHYSLAAAIPTEEGVTWRAAVVATVGTDDTGQTVAYLQYVQDIEWPATEHNLLRLLIRMLRSRAGLMGGSQTRA